MRIPLIILAILLLAFGTATAGIPAKSAPAGPTQHQILPSRDMGEDFEGTWLPTGWTQIQTNPDSTFTWKQEDSTTTIPYEGDKVASVAYATDLSQQDERLGFDTTVEADDVLSFACSASTYWSTNYNLYVEIDGTPVWDFVTNGNGEDFVYDIYYIDLAAYVGTDVHIDFYYTGADGAAAYIDAVAVGEVIYPATLTGNVTADSLPAEGCRIHGYDATMALVFDVVADTLGNYDAGVSMPPADYTVKFDLFGFQSYETIVTLVQQANVLNAALVPALSADITGTVTSSDLGGGLEAVVSAFRDDTGELVAQVTADVDGLYTLAALPYFTYNVTASVYGYLTGSAAVVVDGPKVQDFVLLSADGLVLVIDDNPAAKVLPNKYDKQGNIIARGYEALGSKAATDFTTDLALLGYGAVVEPIATTDPTTWGAFEFIIIDSANNTTSMADEAFRTALIDYAQDGGKLMVSGGEVGYNWRSDVGMADILHIDGWAHDSSGSVLVADPTHYVMSSPNAITDTMAVTYVGYGDHDAVTVAASGLGNAVMAGLWTDYPTNASVICWSIDADPASGNTVFFPFNYGNADSKRTALLENAAAWLTTESTVQPVASISGVITLEGLVDYTGILVELNTGASVVTAADGAFMFDGLYGGSYTITASIDGYVTDSVAVPLADEEVLTGVALELLIYVEPATLTGMVTDGITALEGVRVYAYDDTMAVLFDELTDATGAYDAGISVLPGDLTVMFDSYGFAHGEVLATLVSGANTVDFAMLPALTADLTGTVTAAMDSAPLEAVITVNRADNGDEIAQLTCGVDGTYTVNLPHYTYNVFAVAAGYAASSAEVVIAGAMTQDFALDSAEGTILVIDDTTAKTVALDKFNEKGKLIGHGFVSSSKGTASLVTDLGALGYATVVETMATTDPLTWAGYDFMVVACGNNTATMADETFRTALAAFATAGGKVLFEGGEIGYDWKSDAAMAPVLHVSAWNHDSSGDLDVADPTHAVMSVPNVITGPITHAYVSYGDADAMTPTADAVMAGTWTTYPTDASVICWSIDGDPASGNTVFFTFNYDVAGAAKLQMLENAAVWLTTESTVVPTASISGTVTLEGVVDYDGVLVELSTGNSVVTGTDGAWTFTDLYEGTYEVTASKDGFSTESVEVSVLHEEVLTGVEIALTVVFASCNTPALAIPDNDELGVSDVMALNLQDGFISNLSVSVDISHTYIGDLLVQLTSPTGTTVTLHGNTGGGADNLVGWYPMDFIPVDTLGVFADEPISGDWTLFVSDAAGGDTGVVNEWCLSMTYYIDDTSAAPDMPLVYALQDNYPNPFNPSTNIEFSLPKAGHVSLQIFDVAGRLVQTLVDDNLDAANHTAVWNGNDQTGRRVSSGIYYYRLITDGFTDTRNMVLVK